MSKKILNDIFPNWYSGEGLFQYLIGTPWYASTTARSLDFEYFGNHSGGKICSPLLERMTQGGGTLGPQQTLVICDILRAKYLNNWNRLWASDVEEYDPLHNYDMVEEGSNSGGESKDIVRNVLEETDGFKTTKLTGSDTTAHGMTNREEEYTFGFNSTPGSPKPTSAVNDTQGGTTKVTKTDTTTDDTDLTVETQDVNEVRGTTTGSHTLTRKGNIGVTTSQQMLEAEREVRKWVFFEQVFKDIDKVLATPFYDICQVQSD